MDIQSNNPNQFEVIVQDANLPVAKAQFILSQFKEFFDIAAQWERKAMAMVVTDESQADIMKEARTARLILKAKRIKIKNTKDELKKNLISEGKAIQGMYSILTAIISPLEAHLDKQENYIKYKRRDEEIARVKKETEEREVQEAKEEQERLEAERLERERQEKLLLENEQLKRDLKNEAEQKKKLEAEKKEAESKLKTIVQDNVKLEEVVKKLAGEVKCPQCGHIFKA